MIFLVLAGSPPLGSLRRLSRRLYFPRETIVREGTTGALGSFGFSSLTQQFEQINVYDMVEICRIIIEIYLFDEDLLDLNCWRIYR